MISPFLRVHFQETESENFWQYKNHVTFYRKEQEAPRFIYKLWNLFYLRAYKCTSFILLWPATPMSWLTIYRYSEVGYDQWDIITPYALLNFVLSSRDIESDFSVEDQWDYFVNWDALFIYCWWGQQPSFFAKGEPRYGKQRQTEKSKPVQSDFHFCHFNYDLYPKGKMVRSRCWFVLLMHFRDCGSGISCNLWRTKRVFNWFQYYCRWQVVFSIMVKYGRV